MPLITDFSQFIEKQVFRNNSGPLYKLGLSIIPQEQRGQTCKLYALSTVLNALSQYPDTPTPLPVRKNKGEYSYSLRKLAKVKYGSQVGEIYSAKTLASIAADNGYNDSTIYTEDQYDHYTSRIIAAINNNEAPIIFYDVDQDGEPSPAASNREHAVVVAGYFTNLINELCFIVSQWGDFYWVRAKDAFLSTSQLSSCRSPEVFYKYNTRWFDLYSMRYLLPELCAKPPSERRQAHPLPKEDGGLKNKILVIHNRPKTLNPASFWSSPMMITAKESEQLLKKDLERYMNLNSAVEFRMK